MTDKILIVEDEQDIADLIKVNLTELALETEYAADGHQALQMALNNDYQLILLDIMLPGLTGLDICRQVREKKPHQAIVMLTSRISETDRVVGLELGADDYLTKPFNVRELQARVRCQLRRVHMIAELKAEQQLKQTHLSTSEDARDEELLDETVSDLSCIAIGQLNINSQKHLAQLSGQQLELTSTEFELLQFFAAHPEQVFSRAQLLDTVWGYHHSGYEHTVNSHINRLRSKLEIDVSNPKIIQTVWGVGYKFNPEGVSSL
jgi:DNA-binding response OmpR family regulator